MTTATAERAAALQVFIEAAGAAAAATGLHRALLLGQMTPAAYYAGDPEPPRRDAADQAIEDSEDAARMAVGEMVAAAMLAGLPASGLDDTYAQYATAFGMAGER